jgi:hypothetical protein
LGPLPLFEFGQIFGREAFVLADGNIANIAGQDFRAQGCLIQSQEHGGR